MPPLCEVQNNMTLMRDSSLSVFFIALAVSPFIDSSSVAFAADAADLLYAAIRSGDAESVSAILSREPSLVDHKGEFGFTPLMLAAFWADAATVQAVLDSSPDVNALNDWGGQAINYVAGDLAKLKTLEAAGGDIHHATELGFTPLNAAVRDAFALETVRYLVERGADVNHATNQGMLPIAVAAETGNLELVRYLLSKSAAPPKVDVSEHDNRGEVVVFETANGETIAEVHPDQLNALNNALASGYVDIARELRNAGAESDNAMHNAAFHHRSDSIRFVIEGLAEKHPGPWLHIAAYSDFGETATIEALLSAGFKADKVMAWAPMPRFMGVEESAADIAARSGDTPAKKLLMEAGSPVTDDWVQWKTKTPPLRQVDPAAIDVEDLVVSIQGAQPLLERTVIEGVKMNELYARKCVNCHNQLMPFIALTKARVNGLPIDQQTYDQMAVAIVDNYYHGHLRKRVEVDVALSPGQWPPLVIWAMVDANLEPDMRFDGALHTTAIYQRANGSWQSRERRSPIMDGDITPTAWSIRALAHYPMKGRRAEFQERIERAQAYLQKQTPRSAEESASLLLGLYWSGFERTSLKPYVDGLLARQREDGGWASAPFLKESDAYGTGQALYALHEAGGLSLENAAYRNGLAFLLRTQLADGSWFVRRRALPHLSTQDPVFPHGRDAWISAMATSYAVLAISATLEQEQVTEILAADNYKRFERVDETLPELPPVHKEPVDFVADIEPIFDNSCLGCHSSGSPSNGGYNMEARASFIQGNVNVIKGTPLGPDVVVPGNSANSRLVHHIADRIEDVEMPPLAHRDSYEKLTAEEIGKIRRWIDDGLPGFDD